MKYIFNIFKKINSNKRLQEINSRLHDECDMLADEISTLRRKHNKEIITMQRRIKELENQPLKTIIKYVKR